MQQILAAEKTVLFANLKPLNVIGTCWHESIHCRPTAKENIVHVSIKSLHHLRDGGDSTCWSLV